MTFCKTSVLNLNIPTSLDACRLFLHRPIFLKFSVCIYITAINLQNVSFKFSSSDKKVERSDLYHLLRDSDNCNFFKETYFYASSSKLILVTSQKSSNRLVQFLKSRFVLGVRVLIRTTVYIWHLSIVQ